MLWTRGFLILILFACCSAALPQYSVRLPKLFGLWHAETGKITSVKLMNMGTESITPKSLTYTLTFEGKSISLTPKSNSPVCPFGYIDLEGSSPAPKSLGLHEVSIEISGAKFPKKTLSHALDVSCDDGVFCNGMEHFIGGKCVAGVDPCDDKAACTTDKCDESRGLCTHVSDGSKDCDCTPNCTPDCTGKECGSNGCGGTCGSCTDGKACSSSFTCEVGAKEGTCDSPLPLTLKVGETTRIEGETTTSLNTLTPTCNFLSEAPDRTFKFTIPAGKKYGIEFRVVPLDEETADWDTVLGLRKGACKDSEAEIMCNDDSTPPGNYHSRITGIFDAGDYYLFVDGFSVDQFGDFVLTAKVTDNCLVLCDGAQCGDDFCSGTCGECGAGEKCSTDKKCFPDPCVKDCTGKTCGDDGCGGTCGECTGVSQDGKTNNICVWEESKCTDVAVCLNHRPVCEPACGSDEFCWSDCMCHKKTDELPDVVWQEAGLRNDILFSHATFQPPSCAIDEGCVAGNGERRLLKFAATSVNQGYVDAVMPDPKSVPAIYQFATCHQHYHLQDYAVYSLIKGEEVTLGHKQGYCMEDTARILSTPRAPCTKQFDCGVQGVSAGWADEYGSSLDCQWIDVTGVSAGEYILHLELNPLRNFIEGNYDNNVLEVAMDLKADDTFTILTIEELQKKYQNCPAPTDNNPVIEGASAASASILLVALVLAAMF